MNLGNIISKNEESKEAVFEKTGIVTRFVYLTDISDEFKDKVLNNEVLNNQYSDLSCINPDDIYAVFLENSNEIPTVDSYLYSSDKINVLERWNEETNNYKVSVLEKGPFATSLPVPKGLRRAITKFRRNKVLKIDTDELSSGIKYSVVNLEGKLGNSNEFNTKKEVFGTDTLAIITLKGPYNINSKKSSFHPMKVYPSNTKPFEITTQEIPEIEIPTAKGESLKEIEENKN